MTRISVNLPDDLEARVNAEARRRHTSKAGVIRDLIRQAMPAASKPPIKKLSRTSPSVHDLAKDLISPTGGPRDLSTNPKHLEGYGR